VDRHAHGCICYAERDPDHALKFLLPHTITSSYPLVCVMHKSMRMLVGIIYAS
jgi:hypothetical protein